MKKKLLTAGRVGGSGHLHSRRQSPRPHTGQGRQTENTEWKSASGYFTAPEVLNTYWTILSSTFILTVLSCFRSIYFTFIILIEGYPAIICTCVTLIMVGQLFAVCWLCLCWPRPVYIYSWKPTPSGRGLVVTWPLPPRRVTEVMRVLTCDLSPARCDLENHTLVSFRGW